MKTTQKFKDWSDLIDAAKREVFKTTEQIMAVRRELAMTVQRDGVQVKLEENGVIRVKGLGDKRSQIIVDALNADLVVRSQ